MAHTRSFFGSSITALNISSHVLLMRAICKMQDSVQPGGIPRQPDDGTPQPSMQTITFISNAVHRFTAWVLGLRSISRRPQNAQESLVEQLEVPPLDVLMVWHAYMLSPVTYEKDAASSVTGLKFLTHMPLDKIASCIDAAHAFVATSEQQSSWEELTKMPFDCRAPYDYASASPLRVASIDLVQAVLRQSSSIGRMVQEADIHQQNDQDWSQAISRYTRFMYLPLGNFVPPVDVDIIWHTHQLSGKQYTNECIKHFGRVIDHDDSQESDVIRKGHKMMSEKASLLFDNMETQISVFTVFVPNPPTDDAHGNSGGNTGGNGGGGVQRPLCGGPPDGCIRR